MSCWIEGTLARVVWAAPDSDYAVISLTTENGAITVVGQLGLVLGETTEGAFLAIEGDWQEHATHGRQFKAHGYLQALPRTLAGISKYLSQSGIEGVGPKSAEAIVAHFGVRTLQVLSAEPERLKEVSGIGPSRAAVIGEQWARDASGQSLVIRLKSLGLSNRLIRKLKDTYGDKAAFVVAKHPYRLSEEVQGIGFLTADRLAQEQGIDRNAPERTGAAILHALRTAVRSGHCFLPEDQVRKRIALFSVNMDAVLDELEGLATRGAIVRDGEHVWLTRLWHAELQVSRHLLRLTGQAIQERFDAPNSLRLIRRAEEEMDLSLSDEQVHAVKTALCSPVSIITGGPGTGKTTLVRVLLRAASLRGENWLLSAPTGRAARRLEESSGREGLTIHRLLEYQPPPMGFARNALNPLEGEGLIVDESSMIDIELAANLLEACGESHSPFHVVFVGDVDQLPSVGPGRFLGDSIASGRIPVTRLTGVFRQASDSGILRAASQIRDGKLPRSSESSGDQGFYIVNRVEPEHVWKTLVTILIERLRAKGYDPMTQVQILSPTRKGPLGTNRLNERLQEVLNPDGEAVHWGERQYRVGDRVICVKNKHDIDIYNGDVGTVTAVSKDRLRVIFGRTSVVWERDDGHDLELGYAITIHKSQGSEYPAIVAILHRSHTIMLHRNLVYTGFTRAREFLCVVGEQEALQRAIGRVEEGKRYTQLMTRLAERKH